MAHLTAPSEILMQCHYCHISVPSHSFTLIVRHLEWFRPSVIARFRSSSTNPLVSAAIKLFAYVNQMRTMTFDTIRPSFIAIDIIHRFVVSADLEAQGTCVLSQVTSSSFTEG